MEDNSSTQYGRVGLIGRSNVGKSTLINQLVEKKISAVVNKVQTTRYITRGIVTRDKVQVVFLDTPGLYQHDNTLTHKLLNRTTEASFSEVDLLVFIVEAGVWKKADDRIIQRIEKYQLPCMLLVNKVDLIQPREHLLPWLEKVQLYYHFIEIFPMSARKRTHVHHFFNVLCRYIPAGDFVYQQDIITDRSVRFIVAEMIRETAMKLLRDELPYSIAVEINSYQSINKLTSINAAIWVSRENHRRMLLGKQGGQLKAIGSQARRMIEHSVGEKVFLKLWVRVVKNWKNDEHQLARLGFNTADV